MTSRPNVRRPINLNLRFEPRSRMFGLIIAIDKYKSDEIRNLRGCKGDAHDIVDFLSYKYHIRSSHFLYLADAKATRSAIINAFQHHLIENNNIEFGDAIVIFYAGHGSRAAAPEGWVAHDKNIETICPHDERTVTSHDRKEVFGIPDRTIGGLLRRLSHTKGNNIVRVVTCSIFLSSDYFV
jgi:Caspase domain